MPADILNDTVSGTKYKKHETNLSSGAMIITIFDGSSKPKRIDLSIFNKNIITFARDDNNNNENIDIVLDSRIVSRKKHGRFIIQGENCIIEDLDSTNGLIYKGEAIKSRILLNGDEIRIDDGIEPTPEGVLFIFSHSEETDVWHNFPLSKIDTVLIGRDPSCNIKLEHVTVSKIHAKIIRSGSEFFIHDNNSTNGIIINGKKVEGKQKLNEKDVIIITNSKLIFTKGNISYCCFLRGIKIEAQNIKKTVINKGQEKVICNGVSIAIEPCELVAVIGGSGAGKSTVMNCISGYNVPTNGQVFVNGVNLYENFEAFKNIIGYVPQSDIVYDNLTVCDMLKYTANLRLPNDTSEEEKINIIEDVINTVELSLHKNTLIRELSGGQRKRASIAVELLSNPNLFFLDEPTSGLDPGTERNLMNTLKNMSIGGKTVVLVTHSTLNLNICDKIVFMGNGGNLCFYGSYNEALEFFGVDDIVNVYNMITKNPVEWRDKFTIKQSGENKEKSVSSNKLVSKTKARKNGLNQLSVLCKRYMHLLFNDKRRLALILLQAPLLAILISFVANGKQFEQYEITKSLLFALSCSGFWIGMLNSIQEVCKERNILRREYMTGLRLDAYILSKILVLGVICAIQSFLVVTTFALLIGLPSKSIFLIPYIELLITVFLTSLSAASMGIFVSSLFKNADRAMTVAPLLLMPQILFSGLIFSLSGATETLSWITICRWSMEGLGTTANLNNLTLKLQAQGLNIIHEAEKFYDFTIKHLISAWGILTIFIIIFSVTSGIILRNIKKN